MAPVRTNGEQLQRSVDQAALVYLLTGFAVFLLMGLLGLAMRLQHAGWLDLGPRWFYRIMTLHGAGMVAGVLLASLGGVSAVIAPRIGLSPRLLWSAYVVYFLGSGLVVLATLVGGFAAGWTTTYPLPVRGDWPVSATWGFLFGYTLVAVAFLLWCLAVLLGARRRFGSLANALAWPVLFRRPASGERPLPTGPELIATVVALDGVIAVLAGVVYLVPIFAQLLGLVSGFDVLFAKNMLFLFGHTLVNLNIYVAVALVYATLGAYTGRSFKMSFPVALAFNLVIVLVLLPYFHHLYQDFAQPLPLHLLGQFGSYAVGVPAFFVTIIGSLGLLYGSQVRWSAPVIFVLAGLWGWTIGGVAAVIDGTIAVNNVMHNTLWVPAHFHSYYLFGAAGFTWAYLFHRLSGVEGWARSVAARRLAWLYAIGAGGFVLAFFFSGLQSVPRRYAVHLAEWQGLAQIAVPFVLLLVVAFAGLLLMVVRSVPAAWRLPAIEPAADD
ncbi:cbb3-type cytochrome c oxidase subunit I [Thermomicrobium sp. 4228-Ro]|uniref:cbb3-type cytochrome c oxidase subunit I n=1 Tax=Thermomicrobium sp. 4228-Ro TaxID=2993937 RepID=UPI002248A16B|nr:cbb3-type cytochrome c oxidase subunit I [Thermomicrobium sp. 4228-Ro]MCX2727741.1 cbb3-type cytochrome c oxidase subunit I [Thermomicrobium sp. 4228-Ro]